MYLCLYIEMEDAEGKEWEEAGSLAQCSLSQMLLELLVAAWDDKHVLSLARSFPQHISLLKAHPGYKLWQTSGTACLKTLQQLPKCCSEHVDCTVLEAHSCSIGVLALPCTCLCMYQSMPGMLSSCLHTYVVLLGKAAQGRGHCCGCMERETAVHHLCSLGHSFVHSSRFHLAHC